MATLTATTRTKTPPPATTRTSRPVSTSRRPTRTLPLRKAETTKTNVGSNNRPLRRLLFCLPGRTLLSFKTGQPRRIVEAADGVPDPLPQVPVADVSRPGRARCDCPNPEERGGAGPRGPCLPVLGGPGDREDIDRPHPRQGDHLPEPAGGGALRRLRQLRRDRQRRRRRSDRDRRGFKPRHRRD